MLHQAPSLLDQILSYSAVAVSDAATLDSLPDHREEELMQCTKLLDQVCIVQLLSRVGLAHLGVQAEQM
jgi:hypothetical protein